MSSPELYAAMAKAFAQIDGATKEKANPAFKGTKYADLRSVMDAIKPALVANDLWPRQITHDCDKGVVVETIVCHASGCKLSFGKLFVPATKNDPQGYGSALTYARRYGLMCAFSVCPEDDDGNAAVHAQKNVQATSRRENIESAAPSAELATLLAELHQIADVKYMRPFFESKKAIRAKLPENESIAFNQACIAHKAKLPPPSDAESQSDALDIIRTLSSTAGVTTTDILKKYNVMAMGELNADQAQDCIAALKVKIADREKS